MSDATKMREEFEPPKYNWGCRCEVAGQPFIPEKEAEERIRAAYSTGRTALEADCLAVENRDEANKRGHKLIELERQIGEAREALKDWIKFAQDCVPSDAAGYDWLQGLRNRSEAALREKSS